MAVVVDGVVGVNGWADFLLGPPKKKKNTCSSFCDARVVLRGTKELVHKNPGKINL